MQYRFFQQKWDQNVNDSINELNPVINLLFLIAWQLQCKYLKVLNEDGQNQRCTDSSGVGSLPSTAGSETTGPSGSCWQPGAKHEKNNGTQYAPHQTFWDHDTKTGSSNYRTAVFKCDLLNWPSLELEEMRSLLCHFIDSLVQSAKSFQDIFGWRPCCRFSMNGWK